MTITVIGTGFVGVVTAGVYASFGHQVFGLDVDQAKVAKLQQSQVPFFEPNLEELIRTQQSMGRLSFTTDYSQAIPASQVVVVCVGTPSATDGSADTSFVESACQQLAPLLANRSVVAIKSTVPPGTFHKLSKIISEQTQVEWQLASLPEYLREGSAVADTLHPDRVVIGVEADWAFELLKDLHAPLAAPIVRVSPGSAQLAKYAANAYLATRITFINQIADLCQASGANIDQVVEAIGFDHRIGSHYWYPGLGYGGSCFPKDVKELAVFAKKNQLKTNLFSTIDQLNSERLPQLLHQYEETVGSFADKTVAVLGLSFKPQTDDIREAPSLTLLPFLNQAGAHVKAFDPMASQHVQRYFAKQSLDQVTYVDSIEQAVQSADIVMAVIEWPEILTYDFSRQETASPAWFIDCRNQFDQKKIEGWGYHYIGIGK